MSSLFGLYWIYANLICLVVKPRPCHSCRDIELLEWQFLDSCHNQAHHVASIVGAITLSREGSIVPKPREIYYFRLIFLDLYLIYFDRWLIQHLAGDIRLTPPHYFGQISITVLSLERSERPRLSLIGLWVLQLAWPCLIQGEKCEPFFRLVTELYPPSDHLP